MLCAINLVHAEPIVSPYDSRAAITGAVFSFCDQLDIPNSQLRIIEEILTNCKEPFAVNVCEVYDTLKSGSRLKDLRLMLIIIGFLRDCHELLDAAQYIIKK